MLLTAVVTQAELAALVESLTPMRVTIDERRDRSVTLGHPTTTLVAGKGLRLRGDARIAWDVAGVSIPVTLQAWQILLIPRIATRGRSRVLAFDPVVEELDLKLIPGFLDDKIAGAITDAIAQHRDKIVWDFARTLSKRLALWKKVAPPMIFEIAAVDGQVQVSASDLRLTIRFEARVERRATAAGEGKKQKPTTEPAPRSGPGTSAPASVR
jgi:hypothetical protein